MDVDQTRALGKISAALERQTGFVENVQQLSLEAIARALESIANSQSALAKIEQARWAAEVLLREQN